MANQITVSITDNSDAVRRELDDAIEKALMEIGIEAEGYAKDIATEKGAKDTGYLVNSITWAIGGKSANINNWKADKPNKQGKVREGTYSGTAAEKSQPCVYIGSGVEYAPFIEMGTSRMAPRTFIRPAVEDFRQEYKEILENNLKNG